MAELRIGQIAADLSGPSPSLRSAVGVITVSNVSSPQVAG
jgi:hypothetical protein